MERISLFTNLLTLLVMATIPFTGCQNSIPAQKEESFNQLYESVEMNQHLELQQPEEVFGETSSNSILLMVHNNSQDNIFLLYDLNAKLLTYLEQESWVEVDNRVSYSGENIILTPKGSLNSATVINVSPYRGPDQVRVVIVGKIFRDGYPTNEQVGAYLDIDLAPLQANFDK